MRHGALEIREEAAWIAPPELEAGATLSDVSLAEEGKTDSCASCGKPSVNRLKTDVDDVPLCDACSDRLRSGEAVGYVVPTEAEPPPPPEERFGALFEAARVLLEQGGAEEDQVIPTLAFANEIGQGLVNLLAVRRRLVEASQDPEEWERASDEFIGCYRSLRPVGVADGVVILERMPVSIRIQTDPDEGAPEEIYIAVHRHRRLAKAEHVAQLYERTLYDADVSYDEQRTGHLSFDFGARGLVITVQNGPEVQRSKQRRSTFRAKRTSFLHPRLVGEFYRMLLGSSSSDGFARHLAARRRGAPPFADNLIPACVAFYLRDYGKISSRGEVHRLLNEHVLRDTHKSLPLDTSGGSETNQLWTSVGKVGQALYDSSYTLF
jgi:hypothetical protein